MSSSEKMTQQTSLSHRGKRNRTKKEASPSLSLPQSDKVDPSIPKSTTSFRGKRNRTDKETLPSTFTQQEKNTFFRGKRNSCTAVPKHVQQVEYTQEEEEEEDCDIFKNVGLPDDELEPLTVRVENWAAFMDWVDPIY